MEGICIPKCGSLAKIGLPVALRDPATTQELEPDAAPRRAEQACPGREKLVWAESSLPRSSSARRPLCAPFLALADLEAGTMRG